MRTDSELKWGGGQGFEQKGDRIQLIFENNYSGFCENRLQRGGKDRLRKTGSESFAVLQMRNYAG